MTAPLPDPPAGLSTMWAMQPRFEHDLSAFIDRATELGFGAIEINHSMQPDQIAAIRSHSSVDVTSVHAPAPLEQHSRRGWNRDLNLASTDENERSIAVQYSKRSIELAAEVGAGAVVVHLGQIGNAMIAGETSRRQSYERGEQGGPVWRQAGIEATTLRAQLAGPYYVQARHSLDELAVAADAAGVTIGLETRAAYHQFPLPRECAELISGYPPDVVGYWHDTGHAELLDRLGFVALDRWFDLLGERIVGTHITDVAGLVDHRAPGNGDADLAALASRIPAAAVRTFEIDQHEPDDDVAAGLQAMRDAGLVPA
ncbi:MAG TPA: TIM barrel protein [Dehalococcoidia bacterium]|nr:TIM barrel protein [Dehalococcoidia bacterium]